MAFCRPTTCVVGLAATLTAAVLGVAWSRSTSLVAFSAQPTKPAEIVAALEDWGCTVIIDRGGPLSARAKSADRRWPALGTIVAPPSNFSDNDLRRVAKLVANLPAVSIWLDNTAVTPAGIGALKQVKSLRAISLNGAQCTPAAMSELSGLTNLAAVILGGAGGGEVSSESLSVLPGLAYLGLFGESVGDESLLESLKLPRLTHLIHFQTSITPIALKTLQRSRPALQVIEHKPFDGC